MTSRQKINKSQWTKFWKSLSIYVAKKPSRFLKHYSYSQDENKLRKLGVEESLIQSVKSTFQSYQAPEIQFHRFVLFFRKDVESVKLLTKTTSSSDAFKKLFQMYHHNSFRNAKKELIKLFLTHKLNEKGEGRAFEIKYKGKGSIRRISASYFSTTLSKHHENADYFSLDTFTLGSDTIVPLRKDSEDKSVYKFIRFSREGGKILVKISVDSPKEMNLLKYKVADYFSSFLDTPEETGNFTEFLNFLKTGDSIHFQLIGINYFDDGFKLSLFPQNNKDANITSYGPFKRKANTYLKEDIANIVSIRIANKEIKTRNQIFVNFYTFLTEGIIGAVTLSLDDRRLNFSERLKFRQDFLSDFNLPLDKLIHLDVISEDEIYKLFLQNLPRKQRSIQLRSESSMRIYKTLCDKSLISPTFDSEDTGAYCFNSVCRLKFQRKWNQKYCPSCKDLLFVDKKIIVSTIEEKKIAEFIYKTSLAMGIDSKKFERRLLGRKIYIVELRHNDKSACLLPVSKKLTDNQIEILRFRYPNLILITSKDDKVEFLTAHVEAIELYKVAQKLLSNDINYVKQLINKAKRNQLSLVRNVADEVAIRFINEDYYKSKNRVIKNFGAELFEADSYILLSYIFGNSIWLGANKRGSAFPDGITAFPLTQDKNGCFIWDTKFCETGRIVFGSLDKNAKYVKDGKTNSTIVENGGLKGFTFISNTSAPNNFSSKFNKLAKGKVLKISFLTSNQIVNIYKHYKNNEQDINQNSKIKEFFLNAMKYLLFKAKKRRKAFVLTDLEVTNLLLSNDQKYIGVKTPQMQV